LFCVIYCYVVCRVVYLSLPLRLHCWITAFCVSFGYLPFCCLFVVIYRLPLPRFPLPDSSLPFCCPPRFLLCWVRFGCRYALLRSCILPAFVPLPFLRYVTACLRIACSFCSRFGCLVLPCGFVLLPRCSILMRYCSAFRLHLFPPCSFCVAAFDFRFYGGFFVAFDCVTCSRSALLRLPLPVHLRLTRCRWMPLRWVPPPLPAGALLPFFCLRYVAHSCAVTFTWRYLCDSVLYRTALFCSFTPVFLPFLCVCCRTTLFALPWSACDFTARLELLCLPFCVAYTP